MRYVIVGTSAAGTAAARTIRQADPAGEIVMLSKDNAFFSRCQLHMLAAGKRSHEQADFLPEGWAQSAQIDLRWNTSAVALDPQARVLKTSAGASLCYDRLLIATGSRTWLPPIDGLAGERTYGLRDLADADHILAALSIVETVTIIGAGLVGCELAAALAEEGKRVNVVELSPFPLPLQLEAESGARCARRMAEVGIRLHCGHKVVGVERNTDGTPAAVILEDGSKLAADLIVAAAGVRPNIEWLAGSGVATDPKGILIDEHGRTNVDGVYAAGDVTVMEDALLRTVMPSAIWPAAIHQGRVAGANMAGGDESLLRNTGFRASVNLLGVNIVSLGPAARPDPAWEKQVTATTNSRGQSCLKVLYFAQDQLRAAILWGDITDAGVYTDAILNRRPLPGGHRLAANLDGAKFGQEERSIL